MFKKILRVVLFYRLFHSNTIIRSTPHPYIINASNRWITRKRASETKPNVQGVRDFVADARCQS